MHDPCGLGVAAADPFALPTAAAADVGFANAVAAAAEDEEDAEGVSEAAAAPPDDAPASPPADTRLAGADRALARGWRVRAADNLAAVRLSRALETEGRAPTPDEAALLLRFTGFGAREMANRVFPAPGAGEPEPAWAAIAEGLRAAVPPAEHAALRRATQYAHHTPEPLGRALWAAALHLGFRGGRVLEPGMGVGLLLALRPEALADGAVRATGVELCATSARIARLLHPSARVRAEDYTRSRLPGGFDLAIGNPPFSRRLVRPPRGSGPAAGLPPMTLHDHFIAASVARLRPGGIALFVTSTGTLDKPDPAARRHIAGLADLLGAVRVPAGSFRATAGTEVTVDLLALRRRGPDEAPAGAPWALTVPVALSPEGGEPDAPETLPVNEWFASHPEAALGRHVLRRGVHGPGLAYALAGDPGPDLETRVTEALLRHLPEGAHDPAPAGWEEAPEPDNLAPVAPEGDGGDPARREGSFLVAPDGAIRQVVDGAARDVAVRRGGAGGRGGEGIAPRDAEVVRALVPVRDALRAVLRAQAADLPWEAEARRLRVAYMAFVRRFGPVNRAEVAVRVDGETGERREAHRRPNLAPFADDPDCWLVASIEEFDPDTGLARPGAVFDRRVVAPPAEPAVASAADALAVALSETGAPDLGRVAELLGVEEDAAEAALGDLVFRHPRTGALETADAHLSGPVRAKLAAAREADAAEPGRWARNVSALEAVQPEDLRPSDISARLGAPWIPAAVVERFVAERMGGAEVAVVHNEAFAAWTVHGAALARSAAGTSEWGTPRRHAAALLSDALNGATPQIWDTVQEDGRERRVLNAEATEAAKERLQRIKTAFADWVWTDAGRADALARLYNGRYNDLRPRAFDGSHLALPGMSAAGTLRPQQRRAIWRVVSAGSTYVAHAVGAGKAQPVDAKVLTPTGWRRMGDLRPGDEVIAGDGSPTRVAGVFPQGEKEIYRVRFSDGSATECCDEHLWLTQTYAERTASSAVRRLGRDWPSAGPKVRSLGEIRRSLVAPRLGAKNHSIPMVGSVRFEPRAVPLDPYLLGVILGDGCVRHGVVVVTSADEGLVPGLVLPENVEARRVRARNRAPSWILRMLKHSGQGPTRAPNPVASRLAALGLMGKGAAEKFVPDLYKINSADVRLATLQGLLDTDGEVSRRGHSVCFTSVSPRLADDVAFLVQSLGGTVTRRSKRPRYTHNGETRVGREAHTLCIRLPPAVAPFRLPRKAAVVRPKTKYPLVRYVVAAEPVGRKPALCIAVEHPSRLYVTDDFIVTHNTMALIAAVMEQRRLGLVSKALVAVPGHCLAQWAREWLALYPQARILVADEENFARDRRRRFLARAATDGWDAVVLTHSAFGLLHVPAAFERGMIEGEMARMEEVAASAGEDDRTTRKRIEMRKEALAARLERLRTRRDDALTIADLGVDQIVVDEAQAHRKLAFATNKGQLNGVDPDGSARAWDLWVKRRWVEERNPGRALVLASGTPITNTLGEMFTLLRLMDEDGLLRARGLHEFDACAAAFGDTRTELELGPSGAYRPVERFSEFTNVPELVDLFRTAADVVLPEDLRAYLALPAVAGGRRRLVTAPATEAFRAHQRELAERIKATEERRGRRPQPGDDILLSVITDGRHAAIDLRLVWPGHPNEPGNKLNLLVREVHRIWAETCDRRYRGPDGAEMPIPGATQMVFSDLGTEAVAAKRGFSAYRWVRDELVRLGVPASEIAFAQDFKGARDKARLQEDMRAGRVRIAIGSSETMGTGVNVQNRLAALHHLDVPWLPSLVEQREGRIVRQGNGNDEVELLAYATLGSMDAPMWGTLERKARFVAAALSGDRTIRRLEDLDGQASQFAMAKAIASGDGRLMRKAGLEAEIARLRRGEAAHLDDALAVRRRIAELRGTVVHAEARAAAVARDLARREPTRGDLFRMAVGERLHDDRRTAGAALLARLRAAAMEGGEDWIAGRLGGFDLRAGSRMHASGRGRLPRLWIVREREDAPVPVAEPDLTPLGLVARLEHALADFEGELEDARRAAADARARLPGYEARAGEAWPLAAELAAKLAELAELEDDLARGGTPAPAPVAA